MDTALIFELKSKTQHVMRAAAHINNSSSTLPTNLFFGDTDVVVLTHEYSANASDYHGHEFIEISYVVAGICRQNLEKREEVVLNRGNVCIMNPMAMHSCSIDSENDVVINLLLKTELFNGSFFSFFSDKTLIGRFFLTYVMSKPSAEENYLLFQTPYSPYIDFLVERMVLEYLSGNPYAQINIRSLLNLFFSELLHNTLANEKIYSNKIEEIINYIANHLESVSLSQVASHFYMHPNYLSAYIKKHTGKNFAEILSEYKLVQAKHLLLTTALDIEEISSLLGYSEPLSFHNMFKRLTGMTPIKFRRSE